MQNDLSPEEKRKNLVSSAGEPQIGRRETPDPNDTEEARARRKAIITGVVLSAIVVAIAVVIVVIVGGGHQL